MLKNIESYDEYYLRILRTKGYDNFIKEVYNYLEEGTDEGFERAQSDLKIALSWIIEAKVISVAEATGKKDIDLAIRETHFIRQVERCDIKHDENLELYLKGVLEIMRTTPEETPDRQDVIKAKVFELLKVDRAYWQDVTRGRKDFGIS